MRILTYGSRALFALVVLAGDVAAQRPAKAVPEFTRQAMLIVNFTPPTLADLDLGRDAGNAVRSRMARLANKEELQVIDGGLIEYQVRRAEYNPDASFSLLDMLAIGRYLRTDEYIMGYVARENSRVRMSGDLRIIRDVHVRQPLLDVVAPDVDSAAKLFAQSIVAARRQLASQRRCENDLRDGHPDRAVVAAREGVAAYARSTLARTCLVVALTATHAPSADVLATAKEVLAMDATNTHALEAAAGALDALHRPADAATMWVRLDNTDSTSVDLGLITTAALLKGGNGKVAEPIIDRLVAANPNNMELLERQWHAAYVNQNWHGAIDAGERLLARDSIVKRDSLFVVDLAEAYHSAHDQYRAIATLARAVAVYPGDPSLYALYAQYIRTEADTVVPRGLAMFPKSADLLTLNANMLRAKGKLAESLAATKKAIALDSTINNGDLAVAQLEVQVGQLDSALASLHHSLLRGSDSSLVAQFALTQGNTLYRTASNTKTSTDFGMALHYLTFADSLRSTSDSRFLIGAAALGLSQSAVMEAGKAADSTDRCRLTRLGSDMLPVARTGLQGGEGDLAEAAKQSLDFLAQLEPYVAQQMKSEC